MIERENCDGSNAWILICLLLCNSVSYLEVEFLFPQLPDHKFVLLMANSMKLGNEIYDCPESQAIHQNGLLYPQDVLEILKERGVNLPILKETDPDSDDIATLQLTLKDLW